MAADREESSVIAKLSGATGFTPLDVICGLEIIIVYYYFAHRHLFVLHRNLLEA
jgi:hypothetical protein